MLRMLLVVVAAVLAVRILVSLLRPRRQDTNVGGRPQRPNNARRANDIEDADFREIK